MALGEDGPGSAEPLPAVDGGAPAAAGTVRPRGGARAVVRVVLTALALGLFAWYLQDEAGAIDAAVRDMSLPTVAGSGTCVLLALLTNMLSWRAVLRGLGSPLPALPAARLYFVAQLGKYLPGSVWPVLAQVELARDLGVPRARSAAAATVALLLGLGVGVGVTAVCMVAAGTDVLTGYAWVLAVVPLLALALHPAVLRRSVDRALGLLGRPPVGEQLRGRDLAAAVGWSTAMWLLFGLHIWLLALGLDYGGWRLLVVAVGAYSAAWVAGFVVLFLPAGAGAREAVLWLVLGTTTVVHGDAVAIALVSRGLTLVGDGVTAGGTALAARRLRGKRPVRP